MSKFIVVTGWLLLVVRLIGISFILTATIGIGLLVDVEWLNGSGLASGVAAIAILRRFQVSRIWWFGILIPFVMFIWSVFSTWLWVGCYLLLNKMIGVDEPLVWIAGIGVGCFLCSIIKNKDVERLYFDKAALGLLLLSFSTLLFLNRSYRDFWISGCIIMLVYFLMSLWERRPRKISSVNSSNQAET